MNSYNQNNSSYVAKKKQHYVPKFYLKFFSDAERKFFVYDFNKQMELPNRVFFESQCHKKFFYGEDGLLENQLSQKEGEWATACRKIISGKSIENKDVSLLKEFMIYQRQRTSDENTRSREEREAILLECARLLYLHRGWNFDKDAENYCKYRAEKEVSPAENVLLASRLLKYVEDLSVIAVHYTTENQLITSDSPVIVLNSFMRFQGFGYDNVGVAFLMPISPKDLLVLYDDHLYTKFNTSYIESDDEAEVEIINRYEMIHAERMVYSSNDENFKIITKEIFDYRERESERNKTQFLGSEGNQRLIITHPSGVDYYYELPYLHLPREYRRIPYNCREAIPRHFEKGWDEKPVMKYKILSRVNKLPLNNETKDTLPSKTELKLGCKRMENLAKIYWKNRGYDV